MGCPHDSARSACAKDTVPRVARAPARDGACYTSRHRQKMPRPEADKMTAAKPRSASDLRREAPGRLLELFYPIYYSVGYAIANTLRSGTLTRQQAAILWLIHSEGEDGRRMRRKDVERFLGDWFEVTNSAISKALRALARAPHELLLLVEDPNSGREKQIHLTPKGIAFVARMMHDGRLHCGWIAERLSDEDLANGMKFMAAVSKLAREWPGSLDRAIPAAQRALPRAARATPQAGRRRTGKRAQP